MTFSYRLFAIESQPLFGANTISMSSLRENRNYKRTLRIDIYADGKYAYLSANLPEGTSEAEARIIASDKVMELNGDLLHDL